MERDESTGIARVTLDNPGHRNAYDPPMREQLGGYLDELAADDDIKVVLLRGEGGVFSAGADMANAYSWYGKGAAGGNGPSPRQRPSQRRRLSVDRKTFDFYHNFIGYPKVIVAAVRGFALGGGFEMALMADISVVARDTRVGMPATRFLGPALGSLHMFFYRLGPTLARRFLLTGDTLAAEKLEHLSIFTEVTDDVAVEARADWWARKAARMPADGIVIAKEAFRLVEQLQGYQGEEVASYLFHAFGTNLQFEDGEFNFVKTRAKHGAKEAFDICKEHFEVPEP
ncbi:MAG: enoyl-CoA hydratase/isomerase family protein [bacterium]